jgi:hypothetical protein
MTDHEFWILLLCIGAIFGYVIGFSMGEDWNE